MDGMPSREIWTRSRSGPMWTSWVSTRPSARSCTWLRETTGVNMGWGMKGLRAALPRGTWGYWWMKSWTGVGKVCLQRRKPTVSPAASKEAWPAGQGRWFCPFTQLCWDSTWSKSSCCEARNIRTCWIESRGQSWRWAEGWSRSPVRNDWESWACPAWRREGSRETLLWPFSI